MFVEQVSPVNPGTQAQVKLLMPPAQVPPFWQGLGEHSSMFVEQVSPVKPGAQVQAKPFIPSVQVPPFWQGLREHSLFTPQVPPVNPGAQMHTYSTTISMQVPPFWQGSGSQGLSSSGHSPPAELSQSQVKVVVLRAVLLEQDDTQEPDALKKLQQVIEGGAPHLSKPVHKGLHAAWVEGEMMMKHMLCLRSGEAIRKQLF